MKKKHLSNKQPWVIYEFSPDAAHKLLLNGIVTNIASGWMKPSILQYWTVEERNYIKKRLRTSFGIEL